MLQLVSGLTRRLLILKSMTTDSAWLFTSVCGANPLRNLEKAMNRRKDEAASATGRKQHQKLKKDGPTGEAAGSTTATFGF